VDEARGVPLILERVRERRVHHPHPARVVVGLGGVVPELLGPRPPRRPLAPPLDQLVHHPEVVDHVNGRLGGF